MSKITTSVTLDLPEHLYLISLVLSDFHDLQLSEFICMAIQSEAVRQMDKLRNDDEFIRAIPLENRTVPTEWGLTDS